MLPYVIRGHTSRSICAAAPNGSFSPRPRNYIKHNKLSTAWQYSDVFFARSWWSANVMRASFLSATRHISCAPTILSCKRVDVETERKLGEFHIIHTWQRETTHSVGNVSNDSLQIRLPIIILIIIGKADLFELQSSIEYSSNFLIRFSLHRIPQ